MKKKMIRNVCLWLGVGLFLAHPLGKQKVYGEEAEQFVVEEETIDFGETTQEDNGEPIKEPVMPQTPETTSVSEQQSQPASPTETKKSVTTNKTQASVKTIGAEKTEETTSSKPTKKQEGTTSSKVTEKQKATTSDSFHIPDTADKDREHEEIHGQKEMEVQNEMQKEEEEIAKDSLEENASENQNHLGIKGVFFLAFVLMLGILRFILFYGKHRGNMIKSK